MPSPDDLRGSTPILTAKDVLLEVRSDVREMRTAVDILVSQNLAERVTSIEKWQNRVIGLGAVGSLLGLVALIMQLARVIPG